MGQEPELEVDVRSSDFTLSKMGSYLRASGIAERADLCLKKSPADAVLKRTGRGGGEEGGCGSGASGRGGEQQLEL